MSVTTTADEKIREAKELMEKAEKLLHEASASDTWGFSDYSTDYQEMIVKVQLKLRKWLFKLG